MPSREPDLELLTDVVSERVLKAMHAAGEQLSRAGVRHWLVGGLAAGAHGHPCATKAVDFLVGDEAFEHPSGGLVTMKPGVPIQANGVAVDHLSAQAGEAFLVEGLPAAGETVQVAPIEVLIYLKLKSPRSKDRSDVIELVKAGADVGRCRSWLQDKAPGLLTALEEAVRTAGTEEENEP